MFLDTKFFDKDDHLFPSVRSRLLDISNDIIKDLNKNFNFSPAFIILTGSLTGLNFDAASDVDLHIGVDFSVYSLDIRQIYKNLLAYYARVFNANKFTIQGRSVEVYFQDVAEKHESPGIYDLLHDVWIKIPESSKRELNHKVETGSREILSKVETLVYEFEMSNRTPEEINAINQKVNDLFKQITEMRKMSLQQDGLYGFGNLVFKELRRNGALPKLAQLRHDAQEAKYDVGESKKCTKFISLCNDVNILGNVEY